MRLTYMSPNTPRTADGGFREEVFNVFLAILLSERGIVSIPENIRRISSRTRRIPDITITEFWGIRVIIEGRIFESAAIEETLILDARRRIEEGLSPVCIAVLYPPEIRYVGWNQIKETLANTHLRIKVLTDISEEEWYDTDVDGLSAVLRRTYEILVRDDVVKNSVELLKESIENSAIYFYGSPAIPQRFRSIIGIFGERSADDPREDDLRVCRIASLVIINALIFHEVLASHEPSVRTLRRTLDESDIISSFSNTWRYILDDINYVPIFRIAREILLELSSSPESDKAIILLSEVALQITTQRAALKHDLMGRIYHRLLVDAKYFGAYYTMIPSATLLSELTFEPRFWDIKFNDQNEIQSLKVADLACGTGTLLKAALESVVDDYVKEIIRDGNSPELEGLYKTLVEDTIYGFDVLPFAAHLSASTLALHAPEIPFDRMNLYVLPLGGAGLRLGSLDFLLSRTIPIQQDLFGALNGPSQVTGQGDVSSAAIIPEIDLCMMNPPFTRSVGGNLLFGSYEEDERTRMQEKLQRIIRRGKIEANITAGLGSVFVALADKYLKDNGHISLVLPKSLLSGVAWSPTRRLLSNNYGVRYVIVSHEPNGWNFSENTQLSECLIIADKIGNSMISDSCNFVNLWQRPKTNIEALTLSSLIFSSTPVSISDTGICELVVNGTKYGEIMTIPIKELVDNLWMNYTAFAQTELIRAGYYLNNGSLYLPGYNVCGSIPITILGSLFTIGPDRRDIHDGFNLSPRQTPYPAIWGHDSDDIDTIEQIPNRFLSPLSRAKRGRPLRDANLLWSRSGRLLISERLWLNTHKLVALWCPNMVLSNVWWPLRIKAYDNDAISETQVEKIMSVWLNSTLGMLLMLYNRTETRGAWIGFKKPNLQNMTVLDPFSLTPEQISDFIKLYDGTNETPLLSWKEASDDDVRQLIDNEIARILQIPNYGILRSLISIEPIVTLQQI